MSDRADRSELVDRGPAGRRSAGKEILHGIDLTVRSGEVHAVMGPNGSGKSTLSHVLMGQPGYEVTGGSVTLDGVDVLALEPVAAGPGRAVPGHAVPDRGAGRAPRRRARARRWPPAGTRPAMPPTRMAPRRRGSASTSVPRPAAQRRPLRRREEAQRDPAARRARSPQFAILDELDSGLDVDALRAVSPPRSRRRPTRTASACWPSPTTTGCSTSCTPTSCTCSPVAASSSRVDPSSRPASKQEGYAAFGEVDGYDGDVDDESASATPPMTEDPFADPFA